MSTVHASGLVMFSNTETPVRPATGFALIEGKYGDWTSVYYGEAELALFDAGRVSAMQVIDCPNSQPAAKAVKVQTKDSTRYVYLQEAMGLVIERQAAAFYNHSGRLVELRPTSLLNPEAYTKGGFEKENYTTLQRRLLMGEKFAQQPTTAYERGIFALGRSATLNPDIRVQGGFATPEEAHAYQMTRIQVQLFVLLTGNFYGAAELESLVDGKNGLEVGPAVHAFEVCAHMRDGGLTVVRVLEDDGTITDRTSNGSNALDVWYYAAKAAAKLGTERVKIVLM